jgi:hypothetical protein
MEYSEDELQVCEFDICNLGYGAPLIMIMYQFITSTAPGMGSRRELPVA